MIGASKKAQIIRAALLLSIVVVAELACRLRFVSPNNLISPSEMTLSLWNILRSGKFNDQIWTTVANVGAAVILSAIVGVIAGLALHAMPRARNAIQPFLASSYAIPGFIFYVPLLGVFGLNDAPLISVGFILAAPAMTLATLNGMDRIPRVLLRVARSYRMGGLATVFLVKLPSMTPYLFSGLRLSVAYAFIGVLASEFILSDRGIGYSIAFAYHDFDVKTMYALMLLIVVLVTGANMALQACERRMMEGRRR